MKPNYDADIIFTNVGLYRIMSCPATKLVYFSELITYLTQYMLQNDLDFNLAIEITETKWAIQELLACNGLEIDILTPVQITHLLQFPDGLLLKFNKLTPDPAKQTQESLVDSEGSSDVSIKEYELRLIVGLINGGLAPNFQEAYKIASSYPSDYLYSCLNLRLAYLNPEAEKQAEKTQLDRELLESLNKDMFGIGANGNPTTTDPMQFFKGML